MPSIFDFTSSPEKRRAKEKMERYAQIQQRRQKIREQSQRKEAASGLLTLGDFDPNSFQAGTSNDPTPSSTDSIDQTCSNIADNSSHQKQLSDKGCLTDLSSADISNLESECQQLRTECMFHKNATYASDFRNETFLNDDEKVKYCTGIPNYKVMMEVFLSISSFFKESQSVDKFQQFILTLMRLRLDLPQQLLGYMFGVSPSTVSRIFNSVIDIMNARLVPTLVFWPEREQLRVSMPMSFRQKFRNCACIIDCFEIFIERPSDLSARADTYSQYKSHNTVKYLIGIAPQGVITFISKGWGGRTSDVYLTEHCGFLDNLINGDVILADRGFTVADSVAMCNAEIKIPAFTKGKQQLGPVDIETSRVLASVRIHVERVIGMTRQKYTMLQSTIPITLLQKDSVCNLTTLDKIVRVSCALTNLSPSCVPFD